MGNAMLIFLGLLFGIPAIIFIISRAYLRSVSRRFFGNSLFFKNLQDISQESYNVPLSVSGGTNLYLPRIKKDFPDFELNIVSKKVEQFFISYFEALEKESLASLNNIEVTEAVIDKIRFEIDDMKSLQEKKNIDRVKLNALSIWSYSKSKEVATINFQVSLGYRYRDENPRGLDTGVVQVKYGLDMSFLFEDHSIDNFALTCKSCGGPLKDSQNFCPFCNAALVRNIEMVWRISGFDEIRKHKWSDNEKGLSR